MSDPADPGPATAVLPRIEHDPAAIPTGLLAGGGTITVAPEVADAIAAAARAVTSGYLRPALAAAGVPDPEGFSLVLDDRPMTASVLPGPPVPVPPPPPTEGDPGIGGAAIAMVMADPGLPYAPGPDGHHPPTPITPVEIPADAATTPAQPAPPAGPFPPASGNLGPVRMPVRGPIRGSLLTRWLADAAGPCGEWSSFTIADATEHVVLTLPDEATFIRWCAHLSIPKSRRTAFADSLGTYLQATATSHQWTITLHLPIPQETHR